jgi:hypothetical protein
MPDQTLSQEETDSLLAFTESLLNTSQIFSPAGDAEAGLRLFTGKTLLSRGGTACITPHEVVTVRVQQAGLLP